VSKLEAVFKRREGKNKGRFKKYIVFAASRVGGRRSRTLALPARRETKGTKGNVKGRKEKDEENERQLEGKRERGATVEATTAQSHTVAAPREATKFRGRRIKTGASVRRGGPVCLCQSGLSSWIITFLT